MSEYADEPYDYDKDDPTFVADLLESQQYVNLVADWLRRFGYRVQVNRLQVRPDSSRMSEYADNGDLEVVGLLDGEQRTVSMEVKHRPTLKFTDALDYPYPTAIVDVAHHWENADPKPFAYLILNAALTHLMIVRGETSDRWKRRKRYDIKKNRMRTFVECPILYCKFHRFQT